MSSKKRGKFNCLIIGSGTMPIRCAEILQRKGHEVVGIASADPEVEKWVRENKVTLFAPGTSLAQQINRPFDYLFSIVNEHILREDILRLPRRLAINYHDAPLPKYAGTHATSWAIMNGESTHGISWHVITDVVDAGDILKQRRVDISKEDTALTLNTKCYETAIAAFNELVDSLAAGKAIATDQNLDERTFFPRFKRPPNGGVISWKSNAEDISALVRALNFGNHPNPLGCAKLFVKNDFFIIPQLEIAASRSNAAPGTIVEVNDDFIRVSTSDRDVILREILRIDSQPLTHADFVDQFNLHQGDRLPDLDADTALRLTRLIEEGCKHELSWATKLAGLEPAAPPYVNSTSASGNGTYIHQSMPIPGKIMSHLWGIHTEHLERILFSAFGALVARLGGTECFDVDYCDFEIQSKIAGIENLFSAHLPFRINADCTGNITDLLESFDSELESIKKCSTYPLDIFARFPKLRSISNPGCKTTLPVVIANVKKLSDYQPRPGTELALVVEKGSTECRLIYDENRISHESIDKLIGNFTTLLRGLSDDPNCPIAYQPLLTKEEQQHLLIDWNRDQTNFQKGDHVHQTFEAHAVRTPDAVAQIFGEHRLTYSELNKRANQLANYLRSSGVGPEVRVCVCLDPSPHIGIALLGILKAGGVYVPLDPNYPYDRLAMILEDTQPRVVLTQEHIQSNLPDMGADVLCLDRDEEALASLPSQNLDLEIEPDQTAYIVYTSGTTGRPKGVMASCQNLTHYVSVARETFGFDQSMIIPAIARFTFSITFFELLTPLTAGGTLVILERDSILDVKRLAESLEYLTVIHSSPSLLKKLLSYIEENGIDPERFRGLTHVSTGGDLVPPDVLETMKRVFRNAEVYVIYGCSEVSCMACTNFVSRDQRLTKTLVGKPFANVSVRLCDSDQKPVPADVPGEVYISGVGLTKGYLNQPELTGEKFLWIDGQQYYRTGDRGRLDANGNLEILGRTDFQIQLHGIRIEPGEIEAVLRQISGVRDCVVVKRELSSGEPGLVAYLALNPGSPPEIFEIRSFLRTKLPYYMVPSAFVVLDALPVNLNQKVDRRSLPSPDESNLRLAREYVAPRNELEKQIAAIWAEVLRIDNIGIQNEFTELGGQSLLAIQVISRLRYLLELELSINSLFDYPTIARLAERVVELRNQTDNKCLPSKITPVPREGNLPLSFGQKRLWFLNQLEGDSPTYNIPVAIQLEGAVNISALEKAIQTIVQRHEILRTVFQNVAGEPVQVIVPEFFPTINRIDLQTIPEIEQSTDIERLLTDEAQRPFDLQQLPLFRITLFQTGPERFVFLLNFYHIVYDAWSIDCFTDELSTLYAAFVADTPDTLPELPIQYVDFAHWQQHTFTKEALQPSLKYWREQMRDLPARIDLPVDRTRPLFQNYRGRTHLFSLESDLSQKLQTLSRESGATLFMTLLAVYAAMLSCYGRQEDIVIGCPIANRNRVELEPLIGFFVNTLPIRLNLSGSLRFLELLNRVRNVCFDAFDHYAPFEKIVEDLNPERSISYNPLFQVMFVLQKEPMEDLQLPGIAVRPVPVERGVSMFDLTLWITETKSGLRGEWEYNTDLFEADTIERMAIHFETLLRNVLENPEQRLSQLSMLDEAERQQLLIDWNNIRAEYSEHESIHQLFEIQAHRTPDATALLFGNERLSYRELNRRANQLAHYLRDLGVGPEVLVAVCVERSIDMIVGIIAVLKAGGAYVPLDPAYPKERVELMLTDSRASVLLTQDKLIGGLSNYSGEIVRLDRDWELIAQKSDKNPASLAKPDNLAYVIYTSGSTGRPKGVAIEHRNTLALLHWAASVFNTDQIKGVLASTSICFDLSVFEMFVPLSSGGAMILVENILHLSEAPAKNEVTLINTVPSAITELLRMNGVPASVRTVNLAGEPLKTSLVRQIYELGTIKEVCDLYGPTEDTTYSTFKLRDTGPATIGRPISNTRAYVLDRYLQLVPVGIPGELYLSGDGLARGYLNQPELTDERFIKNPFSQDPGSRMYKTGDLVRYLQTGEIEYLGRIDNQVKIRGFRIELGEIESVLASHDGVSEAVVIAREDQPGDKRLAAYIVPKQKQTISVNELRSYLKQKLPDYMVPSAFVELDELPLTPNGKIDRKALPIPAATLSETERDFVGYRDTIEERLVEIWERLLGVKPIGVHDNFFELGGHSLQAVRMFAEVEEAFGKNIPLATLFEAGTVEKLAEILRQEGWSAPESSLVPIQPNGTRPPFFCIHAKGGNVLFYRALAQHLGSDQPFYGLQARRLGGRQVGHATVEEMAEFYINEIRNLQPEGPYYIGGSSFGGLAAWEIAQQLHRAGNEVALLALFDTGAPDYPKILPGTTALKLKLYESVRRLQHHRDSLKAFNWKERANYVLDKLKKVKIQYRRKLNNTYKKVARKYFLKVKGAGSIPKNYIQIEDQIWRAGQNYVPGSYPGRMTLFRATNQPLGIYPDPTLGWGGLAEGGLEIHEIPGHHGSIVAEPYVRILATELEKCIDVAETNGIRKFEGIESNETASFELAKASGT